MGENVLFTCCHGLFRSRKARNIYRTKRQSDEVKNIGIGLIARTFKRSIEDWISWADIIFVMNNRQERIVRKYNRDSSTPIINLQIPQFSAKYNFIEQKLEPYLL